ncbi:hypothetical protein ACFPPF_09900 [Xenophilus aerolatus]|nr:hypothetical protein [Xenophilus aerolatus]
MRSITLEIGFSDLRGTGDTMPWHQSPDAARRSVLDQYERRAFSLKQWSRLRDSEDLGSVGYEVSRPTCAAGPVLVTFLHHGHGSPLSIRIAGSFGVETGQDDEDLAEQLRFVLGLDMDWISCDATLQSICTRLFVTPASRASISIKRVGAC